MKKHRRALHKRKVRPPTVRSSLTIVKVSDVSNILITGSGYTVNAYGWIPFEVKVTWFLPGEFLRHSGRRCKLYTLDSHV